MLGWPRLGLRAPHALGLAHVGQCCPQSQDCSPSLQTACKLCFLPAWEAREPWFCSESAKVQTTKSVSNYIFFEDFDFSVPGSMKLHNLISKLKKWIKILEAKTKQLPKFFLIEEKCRFLSNFSAQTAEVEIPGEFLMPKPTHYYIKIAR